MAHNVESKVGSFFSSGQPGTDGREVFEDSTATGSGQAYDNPAGTGATGTQPGGTPVVGAGSTGLGQHSHHHSHSHSHDDHVHDDNCGHERGLVSDHVHDDNCGHERGAGQGLTGAGVGAGVGAGLASGEALEHRHTADCGHENIGTNDNRGLDSGNNTRSTQAQAPPHSGAGPEQKTTAAADGHHVQDATQHRWASHEEAVNAGYAGHEGHPNNGNGGDAGAAPQATGATGIGAGVDATAPTSTSTSTPGAGVDTSAVGSGREAAKGASGTGTGTTSELEHQASTHAGTTEEHHKQGLMEKIKAII